MASTAGCSDDDASLSDTEPQDTCFETCWEPTTSSTTGGTSTSTSGDPTGSTGEPGNPYPEPDAGPPNTGPGGPAVAFEPGELYQNCSYLHGGDTDLGVHNLVVMFDGYALMPWAPDFGGGGMSFFDISDPCSPIRVGSTATTRLRESHSVGIAQIEDRWYAVTNYKRAGLLSATGGVLFWDITDPTNPRDLDPLAISGHTFPDAYANVTQAVFWQPPYVFATGSDNGLWVIDASDPRNPELVHTEEFEPVHRAAQVQAIGNLLLVTAAEGPRTVLLDISDPTAPQPIPGGDFEILDGDGVTREAYFGGISGSLIWYAIKNNAGGLLAYDIADPTNPTYAGHFDSGGNGGYVMVKDELALVGESDFAGVYDISDPSNIQQITTLDLEGDLDTATPIGNVAILSVDEDPLPQQGTAIAPLLTEVDSRAPHVTWSWPDPDATGLPVSSKVGLVFNEMIDIKSAFEGSVRLYETGTEPAQTRVDGSLSVQENIINFIPLQPLQPGVQYTLELPANGVADFNGNRIAETFTLDFTTAGG